MENLGKFFFVLIAIIGSTLIGGFVFQTFWSWFIVPTFSVEPVNIIQAIGIVFFINYLKMRFNDKNKEVGFLKIVEAFVYSLVSSAVLLGMGWIITLFM